MQPTDLSPIINAYGDSPAFAVGETGFDISSLRLDELDFECLQFVIAGRRQAPVGIDLGCGLGVPSVSFALAGARMILLDELDFEDRFLQLTSLLPSARLEFRRADLADSVPDGLPAEIDFIYSQRMLHYLPYPRALALLTELAARLKPAGRAFLSVSGLASELSAGYDPGAHVEARFSRLSDEMARKHHINEGVCLYAPADLSELARRAGLCELGVWQSLFGNVKGTFEKPVEPAPVQ